MSPAFAFAVEARDGAARRGRLVTAHGTIDTPAFMPVGTAATVKAMTADAVRDTGAQIVLANTYHLMLRPGAKRVERLGGLHRLMDWPGPILTDSGGFQVMSLAKLRRIDEQGVEFQSHLDGSSHRLSPESCMEIQRRLDATLAMVLDECTPFPVGEAEAGDSMRLSMRWAARCRESFSARPGYGLFGIVQGSVYPDLRLESVEALRRIEFDGYAVGGLAVGEGRQASYRVLDETVPALPPECPRYLMGVGRPEEMVDAVVRGIDLFDCVLPTRSGRTGQAFTRRGPVNIRNARHADDPRPLVETCACPACRKHSRAYLHHLARADEILGSVLLTWHNLQYYQDIMRELRDSISSGLLARFVQDFTDRQALGDIEPV